MARRAEQVATLCSAQTLAANDGTGDVCDEGAVDIRSYGLITLRGVVNNAVDGAIVHLFVSNSATAPTTSAGCGHVLNPNLIDGTFHELHFPVNATSDYTIQVCARWLIVYVEASSTSSTTTLTLTLVGHVTST